MKKILLVPALLLSVSAMATEYNYEISPVIGYNIAEGNLNLENSAIGGVELQYNGLDSIIKPELSILYSGGVDSQRITPAQDTDITRIGLNGIYELDNISTATPFIKAGLGYETMNQHIDANRDGGFLDAGAGIKVPFTDAIALKLEAIYMLKYNRYTAGSNFGDSNLAILAGLNFAFGPKAQPAPVDGDDDNDGVLNSVDVCPTTPAGDKVDSKGCTIIEPAPIVAVAVVDGDDDNDGVLNSMDKCPTTHPDVTKVDNDGCAVEVNLHVNFEFDSYKVTQDSHAHIKDFGNFMNDHKSYKASLEGHTDSMGAASYNQKLSQKRAKVVTDLIVSEGGVSADRLTAVGKGESSPIATNDTREGRAQNRRTEAHIIKN